MDIPVTKYTNENLTNDDTTDFKILYSFDPSCIADLVGFPARSESCSKQRGEIADGEQYVAINESQRMLPSTRFQSRLPFETEASTGDDHVSNVVSDGLKWIPLRHGPDVGQLAPCLLSIVGHNEANTLYQGHIGPVDAIGVIDVIRLDQIIEYLLLVLGHGVDWVVRPTHVRAMRGSWTVVLDMRHVERLMRGCRHDGTSRRGDGE